METLSFLMIQVVILGDGGVGKSCLMNRFVTDRFDEHSFHTIGVEFLNKEIELSGETYTLQARFLTLLLTVTVVLILFVVVLCMTMTTFATIIDIIVIVIIINSISDIIVFKYY